MERKIFRGIGAVIAAVESDRKFEVAVKMSHNDATDFSPSKRIKIDLDRTPSRAASWSEIEVDDRGVDASGAFLGGAMRPADLGGFHVTTLGGYLGPGAPDDLARGCFVGSVFLEESYFEKHRAKIEAGGSPWPSQGVRSYQLMTVAYSENQFNGASRGKRYAGLRGQLTSIKDGLAVIEVFDLSANSQGQLEVNLRSADHVDITPPPLPAGEALLTVSSPVGAFGAVFVELTRIAAHGLVGSKLPHGLGGE